MLRRFGEADFFQRREEKRSVPCEIACAFEADKIVFQTQEENKKSATY